MYARRRAATLALLSALSGVGFPGSYLRCHLVQVQEAHTPDVTNPPPNANNPVEATATPCHAPAPRFGMRHPALPHASHLPTTIVPAKNTNAQPRTNKLFRTAQHHPAPFPERRRWQSQGRGVSGVDIRTGFIDPTTHYSPVRVHHSSSPALQALEFCWR